MSGQRQQSEDYEALHKAVMKAVEYSDEVQEILYFLYPHVETCEKILANLSNYVEEFIQQLPEGSALAGPAASSQPLPKVEQGAEAGNVAPGPDEVAAENRDAAEFEAYLRKQLDDADWLKPEDSEERRGERSS